MANEAISTQMPAASARPREVAAGLSVTVLTSLEDAEPVWRRLEAVAATTPYQRFDWVSHLVAAGLEPARAFRILVIAAEGRPVALLPLALGGNPALKIARIIGSGVSNADWLILDPAHASRLDPATLLAVLKKARAQGCEADLLSLHSQPESWQGIQNPFLGIRRAPGPNNLYFSPIASGEGPLIELALPHKRRTNIRRSSKRLSELYGELSLRRARSVAEIDAVHAAFLDQRERRFTKMGIENVFGAPAFRDFFRETAIASLNMERPALLFHALYGGEEILATSVGTFAAGHYSQYINSTTDGPAARYTLMGVTMSQLLEELRAEGVTTLDMGLGDFSYKEDWTAPCPTYDSVIPLSARGAAVAPMLEAARRAKRAIKQNKTLWGAARSVIALRTRLSKALRSKQQ